jgi:type VI secretion system protein ImpC
MVRDKIGSLKSRDDMQQFLHRWIMNYVTGDPEHAGEEEKRRKPLAQAEVRGMDVEGHAGFYEAVF